MPCRTGRLRQVPSQRWGPGRRPGSPHSPHCAHAGHLEEHLEDSGPQARLRHQLGDSRAETRVLREAGKGPGIRTCCQPPPWLPCTSPPQRRGTGGSVEERQAPQGMRSTSKLSMLPPTEEQIPSQVPGCGHRTLLASKAPRKIDWSKEPWTLSQDSSPGLLAPWGWELSSFSRTFSVFFR